MKNRARVWALAFVGVAAMAGLAGLGYDEAQARPCCSACQISLERCLQQCNENADCENACFTRMTACFRNCSIAC